MSGVSSRLTFERIDEDDEEVEGRDEKIGRKEKDEGVRGKKRGNFGGEEFKTKFR